MKNSVLLKKIVFWILIPAAAYTAYVYSTKYIDSYVENNIEVPRNNILVVDQNASSMLHNGSFEHPFTSIQQALAFKIEHQAFDILFVHPGEYIESLVLPDNITMIGRSDGVVIKNPEGPHGKTIIPGKQTVLINLTITDGNYGIYIPKDIGPVTLFKCTIQFSDKWGIYNEKHEQTEMTKLSLIESIVTKSARQGLYLQKGTFYMHNSKVNENGEEGIDLHAEMNSEIKNSQIIANGEGGLETELGNITLTIENCAIQKNGSSGINIQSFGDDSRVLIKNSIIGNNQDFGIRCALHSKIKSPYFSRMMKIDIDNRIFENGKARIDPNCEK